MKKILAIIIYATIGLIIGVATSLLITIPLPSEQEQIIFLLLPTFAIIGIIIGGLRGYKRD